jgi:hypothetical protein
MHIDFSRSCLFRYIVHGLFRYNIKLFSKQNLGRANYLKLSYCFNFLYVFIAWIGIPLGMENPECTVRSNKKNQSRRKWCFEPIKASE